MRAHKKPDFPFPFKLKTELKSLADHRQLPDRRIPARTKQNVLIATWNLTNFGLQQRKKVHFALMADILSPFDLVAVQEVADDLAHTEALLKALGKEWDAIYSDPAGNQERLAYLFRSDRVEPFGLAAELAMRGYERARITIEDIDPGLDPFTGFNRNPYIVGFRAGKFEFSVVNVHLFWSNLKVRRLETRALAKWAKSRIKSAGPPHNDIILIGDFNLPRMEPGDPIFKELTAYGVQLPKHTTDLVGTNLAGDFDYDQVAFFPGPTEADFTKKMGVFDFDNALFKQHWSAGGATKNPDFFTYVRYYIADHRPLWAEFKRG
jgi:endonuclease/exonuclease/phosphatase family metal-dependent hydrolase